MARSPRVVILALLALLAVGVASGGCAPLWNLLERPWPSLLDPRFAVPAGPEDWPPEQRRVIEAAMSEAYRQGVREGLRQMVEGLGRDPRWTWAAPVVQEIWVPPQIVNALYIPGHREWVLIRPAQWQAQFGLPLGPTPAVPPRASPRIPSAGPSQPPPGARIPGQSD